MPQHPDPAENSLPDPREIDLREYVSLLWRFRVLIVFLVVAGAVLGVTVAVRAPVAYEASVDVTMLSLDADGIGLPSAREPIAASRVFGPLALSPDVLSAVVGEFDLHHRYGQTPATLVACCLAVEPLANSNVFRLKVALADSELSARVANRIVELAVQRSRVLGQAYLDTVRGQLDQARERLDALEQCLVAIRRNSRRRSASGELSGRVASQREHVRRTEPELAHPAAAGRTQASTDPCSWSTRQPAPEVAEDRLALERELAVRTYGDVFSQYEQVRLKLAAMPTQIQVVRAASSPAPRGRIPAVAGLVAGAIAGLLISLVLALSWTYVTNVRQPETVR